MNDIENKIRVQFEVVVDGSTNKTEFKETFIEDGATIAQAAYKAGVTIQQTCGGVPSCTDCRVKVLSDLKSCLYDAEGPETRLMGNVSHITKERLACQSKVKGDSLIYVPLYQRQKKQGPSRKGTRLEHKLSVENKPYGKKNEKEKDKKNTQKNNS